MSPVRNDARRVFLKKGTCSQALCHLLDREFGHVNECAERASDPLAGGIMRRGHQCGMLWGAVLAAGAESGRRNDDRDRAIGMAMAASQRLTESFMGRAKTTDCREITGCDWTRTFSIATYFLTGRVFTCFNLAAKWAPEAIESARETLSRVPDDVPPVPISCASEVALQMGAGAEEMVQVAGFAGGIGLSGNACGALGAAIWMHNLAWCRSHPGKNPPYINNPGTENILQAFDEATGSEILCRKITGKIFRSVGEHTEFMKNGSCGKLIGILTRAGRSAGTGGGGCQSPPRPDEFTRLYPKSNCLNWPTSWSTNRDRIRV
jgi:hypothetical protein